MYVRQRGMGSDSGETRRTMVGKKDCLAPDFSLLTDREREVLLLATGEQNRILARELGISERTVRAHITNLTRKLDVRSKMEAALLANLHTDAVLPEPEGAAEAG
ncbi:LuxR C-terminal-related transcriptional regulator [Streptomyces sp. NPDC093707]|uniref:response regulator transcription factor n=1 Tax=Streptomyces sp. NPDC093707 TaxID=3154984 RepID=UPI00344FF9DF